MPAWLAASEKVAQESVRSAAGTAPGSIFELPCGRVTEPPKRSLWVNRSRISAPAALKLLCPEEYSGKGGVGKVVGWYGSQYAPSISCASWYGPAQARTIWPRKSVRMAVIGRTELKARLLSQAQQPASDSALVSAKKSFTSRSTPCCWSPWWSRRETYCAKRFQWPGGS